MFKFSLAAKISTQTTQNQNQALNVNNDLNLTAPPLPGIPGIPGIATGTTTTVTTVTREQLVVQDYELTDATITVGTEVINLRLYAKADSTPLINSSCGVVYQFIYTLEFPEPQNISSIGMTIQNLVP